MDLIRPLYIAILIPIRKKNLKKYHIIVFLLISKKKKYHIRVRQDRHKNIKQNETNQSTTQDGFYF